MTGFRLGLINPNATEAHTTLMARIAAGVLPADADVAALTAQRGPATIESYADETIAAAEVLTTMRAADECDAYLIACFGDPGLGAARELTTAPVVGICEAAITSVLRVSRRFALLTTLPRGVPATQELVTRYGGQHECVGVLAVDVPVAAQGRGSADVEQKLEEAARHAIKHLEAEAIVLGCGAMADSATDLSTELGVPVCDGVAIGALLAHALWRAGLRTSKAGAYASPEPIPYVGMQPLGIPT